MANFQAILDQLVSSMILILHLLTGRPRSKWLDQIRSANNLPLADLWISAVRRGHSGVIQLSQLAT